MGDKAFYNEGFNLVNEIGSLGSCELVYGFELGVCNYNN